MDVFAGACCWYSTWIVRSVPNPSMCYGVPLVHWPPTFSVATNPVATTIDSHSSCGESLHPITSRVPSHFEETTPSETRSTKSRGSGGVCNQVIDVLVEGIICSREPAASTACDTKRKQAGDARRAARSTHMEWT